MALSPKVNSVCENLFSCSFHILKLISFESIVCLVLSIISMIVEIYLTCLLNFAKAFSENLIARRAT